MFSVRSNAHIVPYVSLLIEVFFDIFVYIALAIMFWYLKSACLSDLYLFNDKRPTNLIGLLGANILALCVF